MVKPSCQKKHDIESLKSIDIYFFNFHLLSGNGTHEACDFNFPMQVGGNSIDLYRSIRRYAALDMHITDRVKILISFM